MCKSDLEDRLGIAQNLQALVEEGVSQNPTADGEQQERHAERSCNTQLIEIRSNPFQIFHGISKSNRFKPYPTNPNRKQSSKVNPSNLSMFYKSSGHWPPQAPPLQTRLHCA